MISAYVDDRTPIETLREKYIKKGHFICQGYDYDIVEITTDEQIEEIIQDIFQHDTGYNVSSSYDDLVHARDNY